MKTGMKKEVVVMNNTKLFFDQQGGEWVKDSRGVYAVTLTEIPEIQEVIPEVIPEVPEVIPEEVVMP